MKTASGPFNLPSQADPLVIQRILIWYNMCDVNDAKHIGNHKSEKIIYAIQ